MVPLFRSVSFLTIIGCITVWLLACKEDELPKSSIEFDYQQHDTGGQLSVMESNGTLSSFHPTLQNGSTGVQYEIKILLDNPVAETTVIRFSANGPATRDEISALGDFDIEPKGNLLTINKGDQSASLKLTVFEDYEFEYFELDNIAYLVEGVTITLEEVTSGTGVLGKNKTFSVFILEDDPAVFLSWDPQDEPGNDPGDVNMDLIFWLNGVQIGSSAEPGISYEALSFPAGFPDGQYGFSYNYYSGSSSNLKFYVRIINPGGNIDGFENDLSFSATYTSGNKNKYDESGVPPSIAQTMNKTGLNYSNLTAITVNTTGSRVMQEQRGKTNTKTMIGNKLPISLLDPRILKNLKSLTRK